MNKQNKFIGFVALLSAGLASICCVGPLFVTALGLGSLGLAGGLARYRTLFLALTGAFLAAGFYLAYRKRPVECAEGSCEFRSGSRAMKAGLWLVTVLAAALATFPNWSTMMLSDRPVAVPPGAQALTLKISGMDCAACTVGIKKSVEKIPGVLSARIDFDAAQATVVAESKVDPQVVVKAVAVAGYKAEIIDGGRHGKPRS